MCKCVMVRDYACEHGVCVCSHHGLCSSFYCQLKGQWKFRICAFCGGRGGYMLARTSVFPSQQGMKGRPSTIVQYSFFTIQYSMLAHAPCYPVVA